MNQAVRDLQYSYGYHHTEIARLVAVEQVLKATGIGDWGDDYYLGVSMYPKATICITPIDGDLGRVAKLLLPNVVRFEKSFNEQTNTIKLTAEVNGVDIVIAAAPPKTCTVEIVEEEVNVPEQVIPARTEKRKRYVLKGDCDPLLRVAEGEGLPVEQPAGEEVPF